MAALLGPSAPHERPDVGDILLVIRESHLPPSLLLLL